jgi:hypothetical protein
MGGMAKRAIFGDRGMLIGKWPTILCMAGQAELIRARRAQIISRGSAMRVVAIVAAHLAFAQRVVIRHAELSRLGLMAFQASIVRRGPRPQNHACLRRHQLGGQRASRGRVKIVPIFIRGFERLRVDLVAINATHMVGSVRSHHPI